jgi:hypothetical protein
MSKPADEVEHIQSIVKKIGPDPDFPEAKRYLVKTLRADMPTGNSRKYSKEELNVAARSMGYRHLDINHDKVGKRLPEPMNQTIGAEYDDKTNALWTLIRVSDPVVQNMIESGRIRTASVETKHTCSPAEMGTGLCDVRSLYFTGLGLLEENLTPGESDSRIYGFESVQAKEIVGKGGIERVALADLFDMEAEKVREKPEQQKTPISSPLPEQKQIMSAPEKQTPTVSETSNTTTATKSESASNNTPIVNSSATAPAETGNQPAAVAAQAAPASPAPAPAAEQAPAPQASRTGGQESAPPAIIPKTIPDGKGIASPRVEGSEMARFEKIAGMMRTGQSFGGMSSARVTGQEAAVLATSNGDAVGKIWLPDLISLPVDLPANLRNTCRLEYIERGADTAYFFTITIPEFVERVLSTDENTEEADQTHTITRIPATVKVKTTKNTVSYEAIQFIKGNVVQAIERGFQEAAIISEDEEVLLALDAVTASNFAKTIYGDGSVSAEGSVTSSMTFTEDRLLEALTEISAAKHMATNLVCVMHPRQAGALIKRQAYKDASISGDNGAFNRNGVFDVKYGIELRMSTKISTGLGSPTTVTTYRAYVYKKGYTVGLAISRELDTEMLKTFRMSWLLRAFHYLVAVVLVAKTGVKIVTA